MDSTLGIDEATRIETVIESLEVGVILLDLDGVVTHANELAAIILGIEREEMLSRVFAVAADLDFFIIGSGAAPWRPPDVLRTRFHEAHIALDAMTTGPAVRTYNVMLMEGRRVGAGLIAVE